MQLHKKNSVQSERIDQSKLPILMQELIELIGYTDMYILISNYGGLDVYIPKYPTRSKLKLVLPMQSLEILSRTYGGTYLNLPTSRQIHIQGRNREIAKALLNGDSRNLVAKRFGLCVRQITNIRKVMGFETH